MCSGFMSRVHRYNALANTWEAGVSGWSVALASLLKCRSHPEATALVKSDKIRATRWLPVLSFGILNHRT